MLVNGVGIATKRPIQDLQITSRWVPLRGTFEFLEEAVGEEILTTIVFPFETLVNPLQNIFQLAFGCVEPFGTKDTP